MIASVMATTLMSGLAIAPAQAGGTGNTIHFRQRLQSIDGLGFAAPFTTLAFVPALRRLIPRPGTWMNVFKTVLSFGARNLRVSGRIPSDHNMVRATITIP